MDLFIEIDGEDIHYDLIDFSDEHIYGVEKIMSCNTHNSSWTDVMNVIAEHNPTTIKVYEVNDWDSRHSTIMSSQKER